MIPVQSDAERSRNASRKRFVANWGGEFATPKNYVAGGKVRVSRRSKSRTRVDGYGRNTGSSDQSHRTDLSHLRESLFDERNPAEPRSDGVENLVRRGQPMSLTSCTG